MALILMVDDHKEVIHWISKALVAMGHSVQTSDHPSTLRKLQVQPWDLAFVDMLFEAMDDPRIQRPPGTGLDALEWINVNSPNTKLALFTTPVDSRSIAITQAFQRFPIRGAVSKTHEGGLEACLVALLAGREYVDNVLRPYQDPRKGIAHSFTKILEVPSYRYILECLAKGINSWAVMAGKLGISAGSIENDLPKMQALAIEAGIWSKNRSMLKGDWINLVRQHEDLILGEAAKIDKMQRALPEADQQKIFRTHLRRQRRHV